ncbi:thermostable hemolysin [Pseudomonas sp. N040]|uniref:thermostable hemolysin n=1 Tax=Pseudomonas sp. N040 TaxID=2785325 RepID=UPI0018A2AF19|nr:thermostable hemolysin [Pseudomonas sp. N040]MBF7729380.1 thermostable hemolysin [Pseudomonas sp. N040]MBW7013020.1 thermostable hemolysin [Pseudomonas sp. N040]
MEQLWKQQTEALVRIGRDPALTLHLVKQNSGHKSRIAVEDFIRERFFEHYGAHIQHFMPCLLALVDSAGTLRGAVGLRSAASGPLFLERYLERPIEQEIALRNGRVLNRNEIVEVGNLGTLAPGSARLLIVALTELLVAQGFRWISFTGTPMLINSFQRLGLSPLSLGEASPQCLGEEQADWGSYYATKPQVMAGDIMGGHQRLLNSGLYQRLGLEALYTADGMHHVACA